MERREINKRPKLEGVEVDATDEDGDTITSCVVVETDQSTATTAKAPKAHPISQPCSYSTPRQQAANGPRSATDHSERGRTKLSTVQPRTGTCLGAARQGAGV